jgi:hypothetical protein
MNKDLYLRTLKEWCTGKSNAEVRRVNFNNKIAELLSMAVYCNLDSARKTYFVSLADYEHHPLILIDCKALK